MLTKSGKINVSQMRCNMNLNETWEMMVSSDYKERFKAEYFQLDNRIQGLSSMLEKYKAGTLPFKPKCTQKLLQGQLTSMQMYRTHLKERAKIEDIDLSEPETSTKTLADATNKEE
jgi:hypothetical protein